MPAEGITRVVYWDASALLSAFVEDVHSVDARRQIGIPSHNLISTLAHAEVLAVLSRMERGLANNHVVDIQVARTAFLGGPWRWVALLPGWEMLERLAVCHALRGADLWHLAVAARLRETFPDLRLLTYDAALAGAAAQQGFLDPGGR